MHIFCSYSWIFIFIIIHLDASSELHLNFKMSHIILNIWNIKHFSISFPFKWMDMTFQLWTFPDTSTSFTHLMSINTYFYCSTDTSNPFRFQVYTFDNNSKKRIFSSSDSHNFRMVLYYCLINSLPNQARRIKSLLSSLKDQEEGERNTIRKTERRNRDSQLSPVALAINPIQLAYAISQCQHLLRPRWPVSSYEGAQPFLITHVNYWPVRWTVIAKTVLSPSSVKVVKRLFGKKMET